MKNNPKTQEQYKIYEREGQLVLGIDKEIILPENAPVRLTSAQLEELDYEKLYRAYSAKGRKSKVDPRVMFKVWYTDTSVGSIPAESWRKPVSTEWTLCGCWKSSPFRIIQPYPGSERAAVLKQLRSCFTSM